jgi:hypothetical protein
MGSIKALLSRDGQDWKEGGDVGRSVVEEALNARREVLYQQVHLISIRPLGITPPVQRATEG